MEFEIFITAVFILCLVVAVLFIINMMAKKEFWSKFNKFYEQQGIKVPN